MTKITEFLGKTFVEIGVSICKTEITFLTNKGEQYKMLHYQDCCEDVHLEEIIGDLADLLNSPILVAEERTNEEDIPTTADDYFQWTFYELATIKGSVTLRWYGTSNGYYGVEVNIEKI